MLLRYSIVVYLLLQIVCYFIIHTSEELIRDDFLSNYNIGSHQSRLLSTETTTPVLLEGDTLPICIGVLTYRDDIGLLRSLKSYVSKGLFPLVQEKVIFFQAVSDADRQHHADAILNEFPFFNTSIIEPNNIMFESFVRIANACTAKYILILEEDFVILVNSTVVRTQLVNAVDLLDNHGVSLVRLRSKKYMGFPNHAHDALLKYGDLPTNLGLEYSAWNATAERYFDFLWLCRAAPRTHCVYSEHAYFVNTPTLYSRENLLVWLNKVGPRRWQSLHKFEPAMTDAINVAVNYTVAWSDGIFTHDSEKFRKMNKFPPKISEEDEG